MCTRCAYELEQAANTGAAAPDDDAHVGTEL